jgi:hypothetical protein
VGENKEFERQYLAGELELEFTPQGTLAEKLRAGGAGIPAFFTKTGVGTIVAEGKELREFDGETYVMERSLVPDVSLVKAWRADKSGNLQFRLTARNFNPAAAMAGKLCIVEVEEVVETGDMAPDQIHLPGIYVHRIVHNATPKSASKSAPSPRKQEPDHALDPRPDGRPCGPRTRRRFLCEPGHRHPHAGGQLHRRQGSVAAVRERHAGHWPVPDRRRRWTPTSSTPASRP